MSRRNRVCRNHLNRSPELGCSGVDENRPRSASSVCPQPPEGRPLLSPSPVGFFSWLLLGVFLHGTVLCLFHESLYAQQINPTGVNRTEANQQAEKEPSDDQWTASAVLIRNQFEQLDLDGDLLLGQSEYLKGIEEPLSRSEKERFRNFILFDFDQNQKLSPREFSSIPGPVKPPYRGPIPDPFLQLVADAVAAMDESYGNWNQRPDEMISAHTFVGNFLGSITPLGNRFVTGRVIDLADQNVDGKVNRHEAKHFLEQQLGIRLRHGRLLRDPTGRVVRYDWFLKVDQNRDGKLSELEVAGARNHVPELASSFKRLDQNHDQLLVYDEFSDPAFGLYFDPIVWFCTVDSNFDGKIDFKELASADFSETESTRRVFFRAFDDDLDSFLSLNEYLVSPLANRNYPWFQRMKDRNADNVISYDEFVFENDEMFQLQKRYYFHRLDLDSNGVLAANEINFSPAQSIALLRVLEEDQSVQVIWQDPSIIELGGISVHPNDPSILFHQRTLQDSGFMQVMRLYLDDQRVQPVCSGRSPEWSPSGDAFVCERSHQGRAIWMMNANGLSGKKIIDGHSPSWSKDGKTIAFLNQHGVWLYELVSQSVIPLFQRHEHRYGDLGNSLHWSPNSKQLAFIGSDVEGSELSIITIGDRYQVESVEQIELPSTDSQVFAWTSVHGLLLRSLGDSASRTKFLSLQQGKLLPDTNLPFLSSLRVKNGGQSEKAGWYVSVVKKGQSDASSSDTETRD